MESAVEGRCERWWSWSRVEGRSGRHPWSSQRWKGWHKESMFKWLGRIDSHRGGGWANGGKFMVEAMDSGSQDDVVVKRTNWEACGWYHYLGKESTWTFLALARWEMWVKHWWCNKKKGVVDIILDQSCTKQWKSIAMKISILVMWWDR